MGTFGTITGEKLPYYNLREGAFVTIYRNADDFMFGRHHGKQREEFAIRFVGLRTTYHQLDAEVEQAATALYAYGIRQGDYVSFAIPNLKETVVYIYACWRIGAIANLIDPRTNSEGILERVRRTNSKLLITVFNLCESKIDCILDRLPGDHVILINPFSDSLAASKAMVFLAGLKYGKEVKAFAATHTVGGETHTVGEHSKYVWHSEFVRSYAYDEDIRACYTPGMVAAVVYTSGTASDGVIKGAVLTHEALNAAAIGLYYSVREEDRRRQDTFGGFIPFFAAYGLMNGMHAAFCGGLEVLLVPVFDPNNFAEMLLKLKCNTFLGVPRFHEQLADHPKLQKKNKRLAFIKNPVSGGDKISLASIERVNEVYARSGCKAGLRVGYGSTELGGSIAVMPTYNPEEGGFDWRAQGNVGYILPQCNAVVIDPETGEPLPIGQDGELCVNSWCQMNEYYEAPEQTAEITYVAPDGTKYYRMGDKGHLDENGCFFFIDRYKRSLMRPDGHTVHPSPIENVIMEHEAVRICAVVGLPMGETTSGSIPSAFVVLREGFDAPGQELEVLADIDRLCLKKLPERDRAIAYRAVKEVPYTVMGKIDFRALEKEIFDPANFLLTDFGFFPELRPVK